MPTAKISGHKGKARIALLTVTVEEFDIVRDVFRLRKNLAETPYYFSSKKGKSFGLVGCRAPGQTNVISEQVAGAFVEDFRPDYLILIGTAGGCKGRDGVKLGDVVVADYIDFSGYWKFKKGLVLQRKNPHDHPSHFLHRSYIESLRVEPKQWRTHVKKRSPKKGTPPVLHVGNLVSGDLLLGDAGNPTQKFLVDHFDKAIAFEMEAFGVARAIFESRSFVRYNPLFLIVRGISDFVDVDAAKNAETRKKWTKYAVSTATAVAYELVRKVKRSKMGPHSGSGSTK
jgi:nucleoside phosphorylase